MRKELVLKTSTVRTATKLAKPSEGIPVNIVSVKIGGQAGQGVKSVGLMLAKLAARSGYYVYDHIEFPSLIRGGHNVMQVNFSAEEVGAPQKLSDVLVALNQDTVDKHHHELKEGGGIIFNSDSNIDTSKVSNNLVLYGIPLSTIAKEAGGAELLINIGALGAAVALLGGNFNTLNQLIEEEFDDKGKKAVECNILAAKSGYEFITEKFSDRVKTHLASSDKIDSFVPQMVVTGSEAAALGAISAGLQFAAIYPMSPISNILHVLAANQEKYGFMYKQPEDEISALNMAIGASFAGSRSLTATSGGGFCLMTEAYGLAGMTEPPVVIIKGMRGPPATGLPTWSEQGDLQFVLHAHQGEFPRLVLAAGDAKEAFDLTMKSFNLADKYQTPVVVLLDKNICENDQSCKFFDTFGYELDRGKLSGKYIENYMRYKFESDGISLRTIPGSGNFFLANSDEHDQYGYSTEEVDVRTQMMQKRMQKLITCEKEDMAAPEIYGAERADITLVSWGSNKGGILQAIKNFKNVNYVHITWMNPFPTQAVKKILSESKYLIDVECNYSGQLANLIREKTGIEILDKLLKYDGRQIFPEEIVDKINSVTKKEGYL
jgi:2-oxoglutarate/2-oxoacid ferredoxin oxidoreductase subunit alpha